MRLGLAAALFAAPAPATAAHYVAGGRAGNVGALRELAITVNTTSGSYTLSVDGVRWLDSSPVSFVSEGVCYAATPQSSTGTDAPLACAPLHLQQVTAGNGTDPDLGFYDELSLHWSTSAAAESVGADAGAGADAMFVTSFKTLAQHSAIIFEQAFPQGVSGAAIPAGATGVSTVFPAFAMRPAATAATGSDNGAGNGASTAAPPELFAFAGVNQGSAVGNWAKADAVGGGGAEGGAPLVLYTGEGSALRSVVLSPLTNHMASGADVGRNRAGVGALGLLGSVTAYPPGFVHQSVAVAGGRVTDALMAWGDVLLARGHKNRTKLQHPTDLSLTDLGYWTDNGAWYHYLCSECCEGSGATNPCPCPDECAPGVTMQAVLQQVQADWKRRGIPANYVMLDSWWYQKDGDPAPAGPGGNSSWPIRSGGGVIDWVPEPNVFPAGLAHGDPFGVPTFLHNRAFSLNNTYLAMPQFKDSFLCYSSPTTTATAAGGAARDRNRNRDGRDNTNGLDAGGDARLGGVGNGSGGKGLCLPVDEALFGHILDTMGPYRPFVYEQDWISAVFGTPLPTNSTTVGAEWLNAMNDAVAARNMTIQFSMSKTPAILHSSAMPALTQIRGSGDYQAGGDTWNIGRTSVVYWALGAVASKDTFWTTKHQPGCPRAGTTNCTEPNVEVQLIMASLSGGPVGPGDRLNATNATLALRSCRSDGKLLRPDRPLAPLDLTFEHAAGAGDGDDELIVFGAYTDRRAELRRGSGNSSAEPNAVWHYLFAANLRANVTVAPSQLLGDADVLGDAPEFAAVRVVGTGGAWGPSPAAVAFTVTEAAPLHLSTPFVPPGPGFECHGSAYCEHKGMYCDGPDRVQAHAGSEDVTACTALCDADAACDCFSHSAAAVHAGQNCRLYHGAATLAQSHTSYDAFVKPTPAAAAEAAAWSSPSSLSSSADGDALPFEYFVLAPRLQSGFAVLGELSKAVPAARTRLCKIDSSADGVSVSVCGSPGEAVGVSYAAPHEDAVHTVDCVVGHGGSVRLQCSGTTCVC